MSTFQLMWGVFWRSTLWLLVLGALLGGLYIVLWSIPDLFSTTKIEPLKGLLLGGAFGLIFGGMVGLALGLLMGIVGSIATRVFFYPLADLQKYHRTMVLLYAGISLLGALASYAWIFSSPTFDFIRFLLIVVVPSLVASASGAWTGHRVARWYVRKATDTQPMHNLSGSMQESMG